MHPNIYKIGNQFDNLKNFRYHSLSCELISANSSSSYIPKMFDHDRKLWYDLSCFNLYLSQKIRLLSSRIWRILEQLVTTDNRDTGYSRPRYEKSCCSCPTNIWLGKSANKILFSFCFVLFSLWPIKQGDKHNKNVLSRYSDTFLQHKEKHLRYYFDGDVN